MNSIRQFFTLRSLAAFRQSVCPNPLAADDDDRSKPCFAGRIPELPLNQSYQHPQPSQGFSLWNYIATLDDCNKFKTLKNVGNNASALSSSSRSNSSISSVDSLHSETLKLGYLCKVCNKRSTKQISKEAYQHGVVIVCCPGCSTNHLIIDNVGWFKNSKGFKNIEDVIAANTGHITKIVIDEHTTATKSVARVN
uniref:DNL-type domain-containing protein n=1 Tax=Megaselia scalaris TaxID=36166 RepID=T1GIV9_MEGSC